MYRQCPVAIIAAREDEALTHGQVMYGLIKPTKDMSQVESTAAMVNVIPKKRIYRMEKAEEIDLFLRELMKRPLVLQPSAFIGRGLSYINCAFCTKEERWIVLINQSHPKICSRIQMGIDTAKAKMEQGEPYVIKLTFNDFLRRVYLDTLTRTALDSRFTFIEFEDAEIVIRYPGDPYHRGLKWELKNPDIVFSFEDLLPSELTRRTVSAAKTEWQNPALRVVMPDELLAYLPGWQFEMIDPLEGVESPDVEEEGQATGGIDITEQEPLAPSAGRIIGRAQRKGKAQAQMQHVPVELHVPEPYVPKKLHHGNSPSSPLAPRYGSTQQPPAPYEDFNHSNNLNEHAYDRAQVHQSRPSLTSNFREETPYEEMNMRRGQYSPGIAAPRVPSPQPSYTPRTPTSPRQLSPQSPVPPTSQHSPHSTHSPRILNTPRSPCLDSKDRYNTGLVISQPGRQTYLTDDDADDGGFSSARPRGQSQSSQQKYDSNYKGRPEMDRYGAGYDPSDRYADQSSQPMASPSGNFPPSSRPVLSPRALHHHQGSGRSDTSASDSGFGESDESGRYRTDKQNNYGNSTYTPTKTPYYNHAFQQESPEHELPVDNVIAKHKALAAQMMANGKPVSPGQSRGQQQFYREDSYGRELQKMRQNFSNLEQACNAPQVDYARTGLRTDSNREETMEESFI